MSSLVRFLFTLAAAIAAASLLVASLRRRALPSGLPAQLVPSTPMASHNWSFVLWLHGLGDSGPANEPIRNFFSAPEFRLTKWAFPSAPRSPVSCNNGFVMPSLFDIHELPMSAALGGGAVFSGWVPFGSSVIERISPEARKTPILWSHGMADRTVLFEAGPPFLQRAGVSCEFKAYPDLGHSISQEELRCLESWIKSRLKASQEKDS